MLLKEFPDLQWLKKQAEDAFANGKGVGNINLHHKGWPNVILHVETAFAARHHIKGSFTIFTNISGHSYVTVNKRKVRVNADSFFISNSGEYYSLDIEAAQKVETFNIHFGTDFFDALFRDLVSSTPHLLENPFLQLTTSPAFFNKLFDKDEKVRMLIKNLKSANTESDKMLEEIYLAELGRYFIFLNEDSKNVISKLTPVKQATKLEVLKRLYVAKDYILSNLETDIKLEGVSQIACLSRFHFLRLFESAFGITPHRFIIEKRLEKAEPLLKGGLTVSETAAITGFKEGSNLSRAFLRYKGYYPTKLYV